MDKRRQVRPDYPDQVPPQVRAVQVRLELFVLAYNLQSMRRLALPEAMKRLAATSLQTRMIKMPGLGGHAGSWCFSLQVLVSREITGYWNVLVGLGWFLASPL